MTTPVPQLAPLGILLPESTLHSTWFAVLAAFVAINTVMYVALAVGKALPKLHPGDWFPRAYTRAQTRSIHPDDAHDPRRQAPPPPRRAGRGRTRVTTRARTRVRTRG